MKKIPVLLVIIMMLVSCGCGRKKGAEKILVKVQVKKMKKEVQEEKIYSVGTISYIEKAEITSQVTGKVEKVFVDIGSRVWKNDILVQVEKFPLELEFKKAQAEWESARSSLQLSEEKYKEAVKRVEQQLNIIEKAQADLKDKEVAYENVQKIAERKKQLLDIGGVTLEEYENLMTEMNGYKTRCDLARKELEIQLNGYRDEDLIRNGYKIPEERGERIRILKTINTGMDRAEVDMQKARVKNTEASMESIRLLLHKSSIRSPISGIVAVRNIEPGERITGENPLMVVISLDNVYAILNVVESRINDIKKNNRIELKVDAVPEKIFWGSVHLISPVVDLKTRTVEVRGWFHNPSHSLKPGMFARGQIYTGKKRESFLLPASSLVTSQSNSGGVFAVMDKNEVYIKKIEFQESAGDKIEVTKGLKDGDRIVIRGAESLNEGDIVEVQNAE